MCFGDGNKKLQATIDIDTSSLGGLTDILNKQPTDEEVAAEETVEATEETTAPDLLNQPVLDKLEKMSENLPERTTGETMRAMMPAIQHSDQMMHHMNRDQMRMLERIMQRTGRNPFNPRHQRGGSFGKGGGHSPNRNPHPGLSQILDPDRSHLGTNPQVAGLAGLFGRPKVLKPEQTTPTPYNFGGAQRNPSPENIAKFYEQQQMATPMQPEVVEEQQQMEILGQPKQFASGGLVNALMATPVGQAAIKQYAEGGDIKYKDYVFDYNLTGDDPLDILRGRIYDDGRKARFFSSEAHMKDPSQPVVTWGKKKDIVEEIIEDLTPQRRKKKKVAEQYQDDAGGSVGHEPEMDPATGVQAGLLSEIDFDPTQFKDYVEIPAIPSIPIMIARAIQQQYQKSLEYDPSKHDHLGYNFGVDPGQVAAAAGAFGHTPTAQISRSEIYGEDEEGQPDAPDLSHQQIQDLKSQIDTFSEIADTDAFGGYGGGSGDADAGVAGAEEMGGEDM